MAVTFLVVTVPLAVLSAGDERAAARRRAAAGARICRGLPRAVRDRLRLHGRRPSSSSCRCCSCCRPAVVPLLVAAGDRCSAALPDYVRGQDPPRAACCSCSATPGTPSARCWSSGAFGDGDSPTSIHWPLAPWLALAYAVLRGTTATGTSLRGMARALRARRRLVLRRGDRPRLLSSTSCSTSDRPGLPLFPRRGRAAGLSWLFFLLPLLSHCWRSSPANVGRPASTRP